MEKTICSVCGFDRHTIQAEIGQKQDPPVMYVCGAGFAAFVITILSCKFTYGVGFVLCVELLSGRSTTYAVCDTVLGWCLSKLCDAMRR